MQQTLEQQIKSLDLKQNAIKILINSFYGAFGNRYFYFHNNEIAQSITLQGQDLIKFSIKAINHYFRNKWHLDTELHEKLGIAGMKINPIPNDAAIYTDTDSVYSCLQYAIDSVEGLKFENSDDELRFCLNINKYRLREYFEKSFEKYAEFFHTKNRQNFELENLSEAGIWTAKKKYVLKVAYKDNKDEKLLPKKTLMIKGLEAVQGSYPIWARDNLQKIYWILLDKGYNLDLEKDLIPVLKEMKAVCLTKSIDELAFSFSLRTYDKYLTSLDPLRMIKGMPIYGKAAAFHNHLIAKTNNEKYPLIREGQKIRMYYTMPNDMDFDVFGYNPGNFPEFAIPMDYDQQFFRLIVEPINKLLVAMKFSELTGDLVRKVDVVKTRSRKKEYADDETFPLYVVNSETLEYSTVPESVQGFVGHPEITIPSELFTTFISSISKYGLTTVIVPKYELSKYLERVSKKKGIPFVDPFALTDEQKFDYLYSKGWIMTSEMTWMMEAWMGKKDPLKYALTLEKAMDKQKRLDKKEKEAQCTTTTTSSEESEEPEQTESNEETS